jgi:hypothetical protein
MFPEEIPAFVLRVATVYPVFDRLASYPSRIDFKLILSGSEGSPEVHALTVELIAFRSASFTQLKRSCERKTNSSPGNDELRRMVETGRTGIILFKTGREE